MARRRRRQSNTKKPILIVFIILLVLIIIALAAGFIFVRGEINGNRFGQKVETTVEIQQGTGIIAIGQALQDAGIIGSSQVFRFYAGQTDKATTMQYGLFALSSDMHYDEIIEIMQQTTDDRETVMVTFPEGVSSFTFAQKMEEAGLCTQEEFLDVANNGDFSQFKFWNMRTLNENVFMPCEGYLFPETYEFFVGDDVYNMVAKIYGEFDERFTDEMYAQIDAMGFTLSEFITLASFVQEEAGPVEQQASVAAVFMARLTPNSIVGRLESNCSSHYQNEADNNYIFNFMAPYYGGWDNIPDNIFNNYNTYTLEGLPAGPITNPGTDAMQNTINYQSAQYYDAQNPYYFFLTDLTGKYYYARTADEHLANVNTMHAVNATVG